MNQPPDVSTLSTEHLQYLLEKHGKAPLYWNYADAPFPTSRGRKSGEIGPTPPQRSRAYRWRGGHFTDRNERHTRIPAPN